MCLVVSLAVVGVVIIMVVIMLPVVVVVVVHMVVVVIVVSVVVVMVVMFMLGVGECGGDGVQSSDVCGSHDDGDYAAHLNDVSGCVNMTDYVCVAGDNVLETVSDCSALVLDNVHHSDHS